MLRVKAEFKAKVKDQKCSEHGRTSYLNSEEIRDIKECEVLVWKMTRKLLVQSEPIDQRDRSAVIKQIF